MIDPPHNPLVPSLIETAHPQVLEPASSPPIIRVTVAGLAEQPHDSAGLHGYVTGPKVNEDKKERAFR